MGRYYPEALRGNRSEKEKASETGFLRALRLKSGSTSYHFGLVNERRQCESVLSSEEEFLVTHSKV
jgi:hypothetical protein